MTSHTHNSSNGSSRSASTTESAPAGSASASSHARDIVLRCVNAINDERFDDARVLVSEDMTFDGVLGSRRGRAAYFEDMEKMKLKYRVKKLFADGDDVCLLYDVSLKGVDVFCCGWYRVEGESIRSLRVVFDPRPVLEKKA